MVNLVGEDTMFNFKDIQSSMIVGDEISSAQSSDMGTSARVTSWRITKSNRKIAATGGEITLMQSFEMVTTRSWSSPSIKSSLVDNYGHAVFGFDLIDAVPACDDLFGWINNLDSLIKDNDIRFKKTQVCTEETDTAQRASDEDFINSCKKDGLASKAGEKDDRNPTHYQGAIWAKPLWVGHWPSFSQVQLKISTKQAEVLL